MLLYVEEVHGDLVPRFNFANAIFLSRFIIFQMLFLFGLVIIIIDVIRFIANLRFAFKNFPFLMLNCYLNHVINLIPF